MVFRFRQRERRLLSSFCLLLTFWSHSSIEARRPTGTRGNPTSGRTCGDGFFDSTFCGLAKTVTSQSNCARLEQFSEIACPSQTNVCNHSFNLTTHCIANYGDCPQECERYLNTCCDVQCCQDSCLEKELLCSVMELTTCQDAKLEACPCKSDNRTATEYCTELVGEAGCIDTCLTFYSGCCNVEEGHLRLTHSYTYPSDDGDRITGRLEIYKDGGWGAVCHDYVGIQDAKVACRQLGYYDKIAKTNTSVPSKPSDLPFLLPYLECIGDEERLEDCSYSVPSEYSYYYCSSAGVDCIVAPPNIPEGHVRLEDIQQGDNYIAGTLKIFTNGEWGYFCGALSHNVSQVACRNLGYYDKGSQTLERYYSSSSSLLSGYGELCNGTEATLSDCHLEEFGYGGCSYFGGVVCLLEQEPGAEGEARFVNDQTDGEMAYGQVEIYRDGAWGRVCSFTSNGGTSVACRQLGYYDKGSWTGRKLSHDSFILSPLLNAVDCNGTETDLSQCNFPAFSNGGCFYENTVYCVIEPEVATEGDLRLVDNTTDAEANRAIGRLQAYIGGAWGAIGAESFDVNDANVACRQLGYHDEGSYSGTISASRRAIAMTQIQCTGDEARLTDCPYQGNVQADRYYTRDINLLCLLEPESGTSGELRLVDIEENDYTIKGGLEVFNGAWGTICTGYFEKSDARVACRQLGYFEPVGSGYWNPPSADGLLPVWMNNLQCEGYEQRLVDCPFSGFGVNTDYCYSYDNVGIHCWTVDPVNATSGTLRLADTTGTDTTISGRLEVLIDGEWGTVCDDFFGENDAQVACRGLGYSTVGASYFTCSNSGLCNPGQGPVLMDDVSCNGDEATLLLCDYSEYPNCGHREDIGVTCLLT